MLYRPRPTLLSPPWGGSSLSKNYGKGTTGEKIGESWELWGESVVADGRKIKEICPFRPLIKLLDVQGVLSVQVHPNDEQALALEGTALGKSESWYVLEAGTEAKVAWGVAAPISVEALRAGAISGSIQEDLRWLAVKPGMVIDVPAGTIHTLSGGVLLYEVQQPVDLTYRLYDWGRPRPLHLDKALTVASRIPQAPGGLREGHPGILVDTPHFRVELRVLAGSSVWSGRDWEAWTVVEGSLRVFTEEVSKGTTVLAEPGMYVIYGNAKVLVATDPRLAG